MPAGARIAALLSIVALMCATGASLATDRREALVLERADGEQLLAGMRGYLASVQGIVDGLARSDVTAVAESARKSGAAMLAEIRLSAIVGLPPGFLVASLATHQKFDDLAEAAKAGETRLALLDSLSALLASCNACHEAYRVVAR